MPVRRSIWNSRQDPDCKSLPHPMYSGHLLKLGSNDRWQSRLFTFDGSVLVCLGKKPKLPVIVTYDPYVSSPFMSPSSSPHPLNPNTKWLIKVTSIIDIQLLPISRSYRCFPHNDISKELSIQTNDGRNITLRAHKDIDLEHWHFILSKIWEYQLQLSKVDMAAARAAATVAVASVPGAEPATRHLSAHQQSAQLFEKYLQKQYPESPQDQKVQLQQPQMIQRRPSSQHLCLPSGQPQQQQGATAQMMSRDSSIPFQIPPPTRLSTFLPQGFDWSLPEQGGEDDIPARSHTAFHESQSVAAERERRPLERQSTWSHNNHCQQHCIQLQGTAVNIAGGGEGEGGGVRPSDSGDLQRSSSTGMAHQRFAYPASNSMEPGKAAIIDNWRRSLLMPILMEETISAHSGAGGSAGVMAAATAVAEATRPRRRDRDSASSDLRGPRTDSRDMESTLKHSSLGNEFGFIVAESDGPLGCISKNDDHEDHAPLSDGTNNLYAQNIGQERNFKGSRRSSHLPGLDQPPLLTKKDDPAVLYSRDDIVQDLKIPFAMKPCPVSKEEDELPLGLIQANRHSRWLNTQLSSEDGASDTQHDSHPNPVETTHKLLPSEPITPKQTPIKLTGQVQPTMTVCSRDMYLDSQSLDIYDLTPSLSNPSLSLHGSSYSHLPIHDPDFVFPKSTQGACKAANGCAILADAQSAVLPIAETQTTSSDVSQRLTAAATTAAVAAATAAPGRSLFTVHVPLRHLRLGTGRSHPSAPQNSSTTREKNTFTNMTTSNPNHSVPPARLVHSREVTHSPVLLLESGN
ncbi:hypothetical protein BGZ99_008476, partial [Dissophora globulifera]